MSTLWARFRDIPASAPKFPALGEQLKEPANELVARALAGEVVLPELPPSRRVPFVPPEEPGAHAPSRPPVVHHVADDLLDEPMPQPRPRPGRAA